MLNIQWPAIIDYSGHPEFGIIQNLQQWQALTAHKGAFHAGDRLIDSSGRIFLADHEAQLTNTGQSVALDELIKLIQEHASHIGMCCVGKFSADSIAEAMNIAATLSD